MAETAAKQTKTESPSVPVRRAAAPSIVQRDLFDDLFEDFGRGFLPRLFRGRGWPSFGGIDMPRMASVDVYETKEDVVVKAELAGVAKDDIDVTLNGSTLTIKAEKKEERDVEEDDYHRSERSFGMICRTVDLPAEVRSEQAKAKLAGGVLEIRIPKTEEAKARAVKLNIQ